MFVDALSLLNFRNLEKIKIFFNDGVNILYGNNAQGKTNILESVFLSATGRSPRTRSDKELIRFGEREAHVQAVINHDGKTNKIDVHIKKDDKKGIAVNGIIVKKLQELYGTLYVVMFGPEDLNLLKGSPSERRKFVDMELCQLSGVYYYNLQQYYKVLKERNSLIKKIQRDKKHIETLFIWDEQLVEYGLKIIEKRKEYVSELSVTAGEKHLKISGGKEVLDLVYEPNVSIDYFADKLKRNIERDIILGSTSIGPHKDDVGFFINKEDAKMYGSQGQHRTAALSVKLSEIDIIHSEKLTQPVVLLDDVMSELDVTRQLFILENIKDTQIIITCTGVEDVLKRFSKSGKVFYVENGIVTNNAIK